MDLSENHVNLHQLVNLVSLEELDLQYNEIDAIQLSAVGITGMTSFFPNLHTLHLAYNNIPPGHIPQLGHLPCL
jgi:hypothetical protein